MEHVSNTPSQEVSTPPKDFLNRCFVYMRDNKVVTLLLVVVLSLLVWIAFLKFEMNKAVIEHSNAVEQLVVANSTQLSAVFAWAVRGEITRNNMEGVSQLFLNFITIEGVKKIQYIDPIDMKILLSTDKKDEGGIATAEGLVNLTQQKLTPHDDGYAVITPVMGLDKTLGIVVVEFE